MSSIPLCLHVFSLSVFLEEGIYLPLYLVGTVPSFGNGATHFCLGDLVFCQNNLISFSPFYLCVCVLSKFFLNQDSLVYLKKYFPDMSNIRSRVWL